MIELLILLGYALVAWFMFGVLTRGFGYSSWDNVTTNHAEAILCGAVLWPGALILLLLKYLKRFPWLMPHKIGYNIANWFATKREAKVRVKLTPEESNRYKIEAEQEVEAFLSQRRS